MKHLMGTMGDRMLRLVLKEENAGACVPEVGQLCYCRSGYQYRFACNGVCTKRATRC
ncbi:hypothetical protein OG948_44430 (plasmid) [Embleya sp. NBC_00888]|uniref:hypothetical protein n=1 Tax=Embleya sp. NBC_00888 TaxID=2975960 RepID=UPI002F919106|nr:hypothetical protein OG948_44430 [Embleya sp. NBC_00888]